jgi:hypothetical protein
MLEEGKDGQNMATESVTESQEVGCRRKKRRCLSGEGDRKVEGTCRKLCCDEKA